MKRVIQCCGMVAILFGIAAAEQPAGVVLYFASGDEVFLLLAEHAEGERGWAGFGGGAREGQNVMETAAHKGEEESRGYFKRADLLQRIKGQAPVMDGDFASFFAEVSFVPTPSIMNHQVPKADDAYLERSTFAWIPFSSISGHLTQEIDHTRKYEIEPGFLPAGSKTNWYWPIWLGNLREAVVANALPWKPKK